MFLGKSTCSLCYCLTVILPLALVMSQDITFTPPNSDGWVSPDSFFTSNQHEEVQRKGLLRSSGKQRVVKQPLDQSERPQGTCPMKCSQEADGAKPYLQRFVRLLLDVSNLNVDEIASVNYAELKFSLSDDHLKMLQQFARGDSADEISLRKVDEIVAAMLVKPHSYFPNLPVFSNFESILSFLQNFKIGSFFISIFLPAIWFVIVLYITGNVFKSFVWLTPAVFLSSFITTAQRLYEEEEVKQYALMRRYSDIPEDCFNSKKGWSIFGLSSDIWSSKGECSKYLKFHNIDSKLSITTVKVLSKMFGESVSDGMEHLGIGAAGYFAAFEEMGFVTKVLVLPLASGLLFLFAALLLSWLSGGSIRLPYFLGSLNFHKSHQQNDAVSSDRPPTNVSTASANLEAAPSTSNITFNFHQALPANVHEIIRSISQSQMPVLNAALPASSNAVPLQQLHGNIAVQDGFAGGDTFSSAMQTESSHWSGSTNKGMSRPNASVCQKKLPKQLTQLQAKYKSGGKCNSKTKLRTRHLSL